jgi:DedD protein
MSDLNQEAAAAPADEDEALKKRLLGRIAIAGIVVVALLGGLAVFEALRVETAPVRVAKAPPVPEPAKEAAKEPTKEASPPSEPTKEPEPAAEPGKEAAKPAEPAAVPEHTAAVPAMPKPLTPPASAKPAMVKPSELLSAPRPPAPAASIPAAPAKPLAQALRTPPRFVVQMGVFNNLANAEELRAKLELNGIPAQIEARVQVGPFATREEADAAREKLRALGLDSGILTAIRK